MKMLNACMIFSICFIFSGCKMVNGIPVIGSDENNNPVQLWIPEKDYVESVLAATTSIDDTTLPVLKKRETHSPWLLRTVVIGIGVTTQVGIGPFQIGALPRFRMIFTNSSDPTNVP
ncbi:MAG: hypothetical protein ABIQ95_16645 [Bdellovibrionia bacterium]